MITSKSPLKILKLACAAARRVLRPYSHPCSPKVFTQPQLFACLVLKEALQLDYRGAAAVLNDSPSWQAAIELGRVPHFTTLQKAAQRLLRMRRAERLLGQTVRERKGKKREEKVSGTDSRRGRPMTAHPTNPSLPCQ